MQTGHSQGFPPCALRHKKPDVGCGRWEKPDVGGPGLTGCGVFSALTSHVRLRNGPSIGSSQPSSSESVTDASSMTGGWLEEHVSPASREQVVQDLAEHFAQDRLTLPEYERRVELAYRAGSADALRDLLSDLTPPAPVRFAQPAAVAAADQTRVARSEEHTSELQSRLHLVC